MHLHLRPFKKKRYDSKKRRVYDDEVFEGKRRILTHSSPYDLGYIGKIIYLKDFDYLQWDDINGKIVRLWAVGYMHYANVEPINGGAQLTICLGQKKPTRY